MILFPIVIVSIIFAKVFMFFLSFLILLFTIDIVGFIRNQVYVTVFFFMLTDNLRISPIIVVVIVTSCKVFLRPKMPVGVLFMIVVLAICLVFFGLREII